MTASAPPTRLKRSQASLFGGIACGAGVYLNYEFFHWGCHVKDDRIVRHIPFMNTIRRHHIAHHNQSIMMGMNMNLT